MPSCLIKGCITGNGGDNKKTPVGVQRHTIPPIGENRDKWHEQIKRYLYIFFFINIVSM